MMCFKVAPPDRFTSSSTLAVLLPWQTGVNQNARRCGPIFRERDVPKNSKGERSVCNRKDQEWERLTDFANFEVRSRLFIAAGPAPPLALRAFQSGLRRCRTDNQRLPA